MSMLIEQLKGQHAALLGLLEKIRQQGIGSPSSVQMLMQAKQALLGHLRLEDEQLYPVLHEAARGSPHLRTILDVFARDMEAVTQEAIAFFDKYAKGGSGREFGADFGRFHALLVRRIGNEETALYEEYERLDREAA